MKKTILIFGILLIGLMGFSQTLIHTDVVTTDDGTINYKWYHERFMDVDGATLSEFSLISRIGLVKEYVLVDTTYESVMTHYHRTLTQSDSIKNPANGNYYQATFVRNYIYSTNESMKRTLSSYWVLNEPKRLME